MRRRLSSLPPHLVAGALVFLFAFGLFGATTTELTGYEPETAAVTEGLVLDGHFYERENPPYLGGGAPGEDGHLYARAGLLQPLLEAPFFAVGHFLDVQAERTDFPPLGWVFVWFYNPFVAALAAVALFALVFITRRSLGWASAIAALFVLASIAWPYSSIGMETTFMFAILAAFACAAWARQAPSTLSWALTGFASGATAATKPYALLALAGVAILLWPALRAARRDRLRLALAFLVPLLAWGLAIAIYNEARFDGPTNFGYTSASLTVAAPLNTFGLLFSPGKGLLFYSPLVVLGALGLPRLWREDRYLAGGLLTTFATITLFSGASTFWGDEVWGPRYIAPVAWALLVPIAWWADSRIRRRVLVGVAAVAMLVQVVAVSGSYTRYLTVVKELTGVPVYGERFGISGEEIPYGDDPPRWIPALSPLLLQGAGLVSSQVVERLGGDGIEYTYRALEGRERTLNLSRPDIRVAGDFWWRGSLSGTGADAAALLLLLLGAASGAGLYRFARDPARDPAPQPHHG
jgi:hypothetical protein